MYSADSTQAPDQIEILHGIQRSEPPEMLVGGSSQVNRLVAVGHLPPCGSQIGAPFDETQRGAYLVKCHTKCASDGLRLVERATDLTRVAEGQTRVSVEKEQHPTVGFIGTASKLSTAARFALDDLRALISGQLQSRISTAAVGNDDLDARALAG
ncbi:MAG: hypothetical protein Kow00105_11020 [Phycisphaeraceae bacterium]